MPSVGAGCQRTSRRAQAGPGGPPFRRACARRLRYPAPPAARSSSARPPRISNGIGTEDGPEVSTSPAADVSSPSPVPVGPPGPRMSSVWGAVRRTARGRACPAGHMRARGGCPPSRSSSRARPPAATGSPPGSSASGRSCRPARRRTSPPPPVSARLRLRGGRGGDREEVSVAIARSDARRRNRREKTSGTSSGRTGRMESPRPPWVGDQGRVNDV